MPRKAAKNVPGTERFRDERRGGGPKMHGRAWHDHDEPRDLEPEVMAAPDAVVEAESSGERKGMSRSRKTSGSQGRERRKRTVPPSKGVKKAAHGSKRGHRATRKAASRSGAR